VPQHVSSSTPVRPLLKWAGGKRQLLSALGLYFPVTFRAYVEPFVGSGAVFFHLLSTGRLAGHPVRLSDVNRDLVGCYRALRDRTDDVITELSSLQRRHRALGDVCYYDVRDRRFNPGRAALVQADGEDGYPPALAAMLIFLNRTGFNGLFRLNRRGEFNVPAGRYAAPRICDPEHLRAVAQAFRTPSVVIDLRPFDETLGATAAGDFVYCDPPYAPLSATANFASYTAGGFTAFDQRRLQRAVVAACARGAHVVLSNSSAPEIVTLYDSPEAARAGLRIYRVPARRAINSRASARGPVDELIVTNVPPAAASTPAAARIATDARPASEKFRMAKAGGRHRVRTA
jgi:DNA adenine methylase